MTENAYRVFPYRWVVLAVFALINAVIQLNWIAFAPVTVDAIALYQKSAFWIVLLSMSFMIVYIFVSVPASFIIDRYGIRIGVGIGAVLTGIFGMVRGYYGTDYTMVCISQFALAAAQPFIMNAMTKVAAEWFPIHERATATGITALAQFLGIILAMAVTKPLAQSFLPEGAKALTLPALQSMLYIYGVVSVISAILFLLLARDKPVTPPCSMENYERSTITEGLKYIFTRKDSLLLLGIFFIGLGMFNAITTFVDLLLASKGFTAGGNEAGNVGAVMMIAGLLGAVTLPPLSDKFRKRKIFMQICLFFMLPGLLGLTICTGYVPLLISSGIFGFFFMAAAPLGYQYAAEVSHPAPESTSQGMIVLSGQISGAIFITLMAILGGISAEALADASKAAETINLTPFMWGFFVLGIINVIFSSVIKESEMIKSDKDTVN